ncbi:DNA helicase [Tanacetum coccineum]
MLGAIVYEPGPDTQMDYDIVLEERSGYPQRVNKLHPSYMSLQFPLLFLYGEDGYSKDLKLVGGTANSNADRRLTMKAYYAYFIHDRANCFNYLSRTGRLFQQYVVTAFCAIEQNWIDFIREHQNDIRNEYLSGIYDAISRGDNDGSSCGAKLILPQSFTGGPRYMYSHYLDALAICRVHGNPSFFITFTCNVKWPEITEYMADFPLLTTADRADIVDRRTYNRPELAREKEKLLPKLNDKQRRIFDLFVSARMNHQQELIFVYGHGGTGKTFLWKTIIYALRAEGKIVLGVASSSVASLLLPVGRTAHSRFNLPLDLSDTSVCSIKKNTHLATLIKETSLIVWDESPMNDRRCFETLDTTLRDILDMPDTLFGGKTVMLGGDFRQTLPVKKQASRDELIGLSIAESYLWKHFKLYCLTENMRLSNRTLHETDKEKVGTFANWLLDIGNGNIGAPDEVDPENTSWVDIPDMITTTSIRTENRYSNNTVTQPQHRGWSLQRDTPNCKATATKSDRGSNSNRHKDFSESISSTHPANNERPQNTFRLQKKAIPDKSMLCDDH